MSKRVSNKKAPRRTGTTYGRQRVRLGWRKRLLKALREEQRIKAALARSPMEAAI